MFRGWIPTVNGRLSFRIIGDSTTPNRAISDNIKIDGKRYIACYQKRPCNDQLFYPISNYYYGLESNFWFVLLARSSEHDLSVDTRLVGRMYIFKSKKDWRSKGEPPIKSFQNLLERCQSEYGIHQPTKKEIFNEYTSLQSNLNEISDIYCNFIVRRDGIVAINKLTFTDNELKQASIDFADVYKRNLLKEVSDRFYFFLRDISHSHQHHNPSTDTILTLHKSSCNDPIWAANVIYSLYYHTIQLKRNEDDRDHLDSLGILAYIKSFKKILDRRLIELGTTLEKSTIPKFNDEALNDSVSATKDKINLIIERDELKSSRIRNFIIGISSITLALMTIIIGFTEKNRELDPMMVCIGNSIAINFSHWMILIIFSLSIYYVYYKLDIINDIKFFRDSFRMGNFFRKSKHVSANILVFLFVFIGSISLSVHVDRQLNLTSLREWLLGIFSPISHVFNSCV